MKTLVRYWLFQIPGFSVLGALLFVAYGQEWLSLRTTLALLAMWVVKDMLAYPFVKKSYEMETKTGPEVLVGKPGVVVHEVGEETYVRVQGELWRARHETEGLSLASDARVVVTGAEGLTLIVDVPDRP